MFIDQAREIILIGLCHELLRIYSPGGSVTVKKSSGGSVGVKTSSGGSVTVKKSSGGAPEFLSCLLRGNGKVTTAGSVLQSKYRPLIWTISHGRTPFISAAGGLRCCLLSEDYGDKAVSVFETRIEGGAKSDLALLSVFRSRCSFSREIVTVQSPKEEN
ncbi:hypothetical protein NC652_000397 [Populus alba x Populus x berolinensis]|nr:hypothetical protein NC652_000397 [Populus alba x Populus x berolinensis]